ncbi:MAG: heavy metal-responsive transcriptional regulator [Candidatus Binatia bacterium]|nr:MAG: heavy metal-responsive transcriptional regulator [Candidatus Binatia bacterium]
MFVSQLARQAAVTPDTVRYYERVGLLPKPPRSASGYRIYDETTLKRLLFIRKAQALGFSLSQIEHILNLQGRGKETCRCVLAMAEATLTATEEKLKDLQRFHEQLRKMIVRWRRRLSNRRLPLAAEFCALIESHESV